VTIAKRPSYRARDGRENAGDLPDIASEDICDRLARRANHLVIPEAANGSRECAPDDRLRGYPESICQDGVCGEMDSGSAPQGASRNDGGAAKC
jgi:hypothetical protein